MKLTVALLSFIFVVVFPHSVFAADIPQDNIGAQKYDRQQCIDNATQTCINASCLNSDQIDCQDNCSKMSQEKCRQESNE